VIVAARQLPERDEGFDPPPHATAYDAKTVVAFLSGPVFVTGGTNAELTGIVGARGQDGTVAPQDASVFLTAYRRH
jgi:hypothetical protein